MGKHKSVEKSDFKLEGRFLGFSAKDGYKLKYLRLATASGEIDIKLPKELRLSLWRSLMPGEWIQVTGLQKRDELKETIKFKADDVVPVVPSSVSSEEPDVASVNSSPKAAVPPAKSTILVCQKSDCCKRGGRQVTRALQDTLSDRGLADQVKIKGTGCMKRCKAGPNIVMPDKTRYSRISSDAIPEIIDQHFSEASKNEAAETPAESPKAANH